MSIFYTKRIQDVVKRWGKNISCCNELKFKIFLLMKARIIGLQARGKFYRSKASEKHQYATNKLFYFEELETNTR